ncbi:MAG TPA: class I SAM-dependent methyltransferase [Chloroflexota bacterium]|jgi:2-polyprenyl-6-hydroxyphenyl methylase/3-demethylubiquinone-9 3-methyltransferase|nr:class I SAM-dependent methyltransferase [Chloroflexota bacterium]
MSAPSGTEHGARFAFGENWAQFLSRVDRERLEAAETALTQALGQRDLSGQRFLDAGSGSGLSSLAARRLDASVHSFDFDPASVRCTQQLRDRFFPDDPHWIVERGDVLDPRYLESLGQFDIVYSWGVLHHTGNMWQAVENVITCVRPGGKFLISIYNDTGLSCRIWTVEKRMFVRSPRAVQIIVALAYTALVELAFAGVRVTRGKNPFSMERWRRRKQRRGMSMWHDNVDWLGGYPYDYARPDEVFRFVRDRGFELQHLTTTPHNGCNEYVFMRSMVE